MLQVLEVLDLLTKWRCCPSTGKEVPIEVVTSSLISSMMSNRNIKLLSKTELLNYVKDEYISGLSPSSPNVLVMAGAGDIDAVVMQVKEIIEQTSSGL